MITHTCKSLQGDKNHYLLYCIYGNNDMVEKYPKAYVKKLFTN